MLLFKQRLNFREVGIIAEQFSNNTAAAAALAIVLLTLRRFVLMNSWEESQADMFPTQDRRGKFVTFASLL